MKKQSPNETGWRGSSEVWLQAASEILVESGVENVKIATLAKRLSLSRTSFYWFFNDREALLTALMQRWKEKNTGNIIRQSEAYADSLAEATLNIFDCWLDNGLFDDRFEFAIRSWSLQSNDILAEVHSADQLRLDALAAMFKRYGFNDVEADVHARTIYLVQIGYISMQTQESLEVRMQRIPEYVKTFTGEYPELHELARFHFRHGYSGP
ncbi:TetR/AcrR family transcriptional regulator [Oceanospirillum sediminis]|uniref:TetR/AcrR family transcriptional regulator n=1 Tax=Oceanospirillum sediminis TaxID=2760088 RepID=A0A839IU45_9GAMM|nr:TetR/AcrR family transcriptional regulator [Oceanospirillum sediminis]MBB1488875.1 TetR/AcrR family transcriptional regulator [Oceanospirillum sediminis]